jgi:hypothetical protein
MGANTWEDPGAGIVTSSTSGKPGQFLSLCMNNSENGTQYHAGKVKENKQGEMTSGLDSATSM